MNISSEFSKHAEDYNDHNIIQNKVIDKLLLHVEGKPENILDLGCGNGGLYKVIDWKVKHFKGIDFAPKMLELHPKGENIETIYGDFNDRAFFDKLNTHKYDYILSASALQWAGDLDFVFKKIKELDAPIALAIFTSNTFKTLNKTASINSLLRSSDEVHELQKKYFDASYEVVEYKLEFESTRDMFRYIKKSGVSGSRKVLSYKESKKLFRDYPVNYLEFEVAFIYSKNR
ncbi:methyltransferase [Sulfurimonas sp.]|nr:methyltransferase [Sulfurimonas sp.]